MTLNEHINCKISYVRNSKMWKIYAYSYGGNKVFRGQKIGYRGRLVKKLMIMNNQLEKVKFARFPCPQNSKHLVTWLRLLFVFN